MQRSTNQKILLVVSIIEIVVAALAIISAIAALAGGALLAGSGTALTVEDETVAAGAAGMVVVASETSPADLCARYGYELMTVRPDPLGARIV